MKLYEIEQMLTEAIDQAHRQAEENHGEISELTSYYIDHWVAEKEQKISNTCKLIKNLLAESSAVAEEAKKLNDRARVTKNKAESVKAWLAGFMDGEKWSDANSKISWRKSESVEISDIDLVPDQFIDMIPKANKLEIKKILLSGGEIDGCKLEKKQNIQIK